MHINMYPSLKHEESRRGMGEVAIVADHAGTTVNRMGIEPTREEGRGKRRGGRWAYVDGRV